MRFFLAASVALNLLLLTTIVAARIDPERSRVSGRDWPLEPTSYDSPPIAADGALGIEDMLAILSNTPLGKDQIKALLVGWLETGRRRGYAAEAAAYWEQDYSPARQNLRAELAIEDSIRRDLLQLFGPDAVGDPAFDTVFRPLGPAYAFLGSGAQLDLQRRQLEALEASPVSPVDRPQSRMLCRPIDPDAAGFERPQSSLAGRLTAREDREYRLRFSPLAAQLRESRVASDETEFRELFDLVQKLDQAPSARDQAEGRAELRARLGDERFDRFWSLRDPFFGAIDEYLRREGFPESDVSSAYSIVNRSQDALLRQVGRQSDNDSMLAAVARVRQDEAAQLTRLLGERAATGVAAAVTRFAQRLGEGC